MYCMARWIMSECCFLTSDARAGKRGPRPRGIWIWPRVAWTDLIHTERAETMEQQEFANVWDALSNSSDEAANMTMRSNLIIAIQRKVAGWRSRRPRPRAAFASPNHG